jgi:putative transposase
VPEVRSEFLRPSAPASTTTRRQVKVFIRIQGVQHYLWRAVDQHGVVLDILIQARRDAQAAKRFFNRLLTGLQFEPRVIVTDELRSYGVAQRQLLPSAEHRQSRYLNNRAENSHRPTRRRERQMQRFKSSWQAQDFLSAHAFYDHFRPRRHQLTAFAIAKTGPRPSMSGTRTPALGTQHNRHCTTTVAPSASATG